MIKVRKHKLRKIAEKFKRQEEKEHLKKLLEQDFPTEIYEAIQTIEYNMLGEANQGKFSAEVPIEQAQYPTLANIFRDFKPELNFDAKLGYYLISLKW